MNCRTCPLKSINICLMCKKRFCDSCVVYKGFGALCWTCNIMCADCIEERKDKSGKRCFKCNEITCLRHMFIYKQLYTNINHEIYICRFCIIKDINPVVLK